MNHLKDQFIKCIKIILLGVIFLVCNPLSSSGQHISDSIPSDSIEKVPKFNRHRIAFNYSSSNTFLGRTDTVPIPLLSPTYKFTSYRNYFIQTSLVHTNTTSKIFDELDVKTGYYFYPSDRFDLSFSYAHYFFNKKVTRFNSLINNDLYLYAGYDFYAFFSAISFDFTYGKKTFWVPHTVNGTLKLSPVVATAKDFTFTWINQRQFYFYDVLKSKDKLIITAEIDVLFGTQNNSVFYHNKVKNSNYDVHTPFNLKAYIFNFDLLYTRNKWSFNFSPYYTIPKNVSTGQESKPYLVWYGGLYYTIKKEKKSKNPDHLKSKR